MHRTTSQPSHSGGRSPGGIILLLVLLWTAAFLTCTNQAQAGPENFPTPKWLTSEQVAQQMIINGLPSTVYYFEAHKGVDDLLGFYRQQWNDGRPGKSGFREAHVPPWHIISRLDREFLYTVQVQNSDVFSIRGYLAVANLKEIQKKSDSREKVPQMNGSQIINDVTSFDPGKKGRTLLLVNKYSIASNSAYYRNYYLDRGWGKLIDTDSKDAFILAFQKQGTEAHLVFSSLGDSTTIVMNIIEKN